MILGRVHTSANVQKISSEELHDEPTEELEDNSSTMDEGLLWYQSFLTVGLYS